MALKHSKLKNTGLLFELLVRQITADALDGKEGHCLPLLKKYFKGSTELGREYQLYKSLNEEKFDSDSKGTILIESVLNARKKIDNRKLREQKYQLISEIKTHYNIDDFFKTQLPNYKYLASIYKIFEYSSAEDPSDYTKSKIFILENLTNKAQEKTLQPSELSEFSKLPKDIRSLAYKLLVERFNQKHADLGDRHKALIREYINSVSNTTGFSDFIKSESVLVKEEISSIAHTLGDKRIKIRLNEACNLLDEYSTIDRVDERHIFAMLKYYDLLEEIGHA